MMVYKKNNIKMCMLEANKNKIGELLHLKCRESFKRSRNENIVILIRILALEMQS